MSTNAPSATAKAEAPAAAAPPAPPAGGGLKAWLPLLLTLLLMPALAYAVTNYVLLPKLKKSLGASEPQSAGGEGGEEHGEGGEEHGKGGGKPGGKGGETGKGKQKIPLAKIVVNVSGSQGSRLLLASLTLVGSAKDFKERLEDNSDQLRDIASGTLSGKTIGDLEKPEARNLLRAELLSQFGSILGSGFIQDIYITELAIQ